MFFSLCTWWRPFWKWSAERSAANEVTSTEGQHVWAWEPATPLVRENSGPSGASLCFHTTNHVEVSCSSRGELRRYCRQAFELHHQVAVAGCDVEPKCGSCRLCRLPWHASRRRGDCPEWRQVIWPHSRAVEMSQRRWWYQLRQSISAEQTYRILFVRFVLKSRPNKGLYEAKQNMEPTTDKTTTGTLFANHWIIQAVTGT